MASSVCTICNKEFKIKPSRLKKGEGKYCSMKCYGVDISKRQVGKNNHAWKGKVTSKCVICNNIFEQYPSEAIKVTTCSKSCSRKLRSKNQKGNKNSCWRGGFSPINSRIRATSKYSLWRQQVFINDDFTCNSCGQKGGKIEAHHKRRFHKLVKEAYEKMPLFDVFDAAMAYSPLWNTSNGITLCEKCHKRLGTH